MVMRMSKRRTKWNRRILIAKSLRDITLTRVKEHSDLWCTTADIQDYWKDHFPTARHKSMSTSELDNRFKHIRAQPFMEERYVDTVAIKVTESLGWKYLSLVEPRLTRVRVRRMQYQITDLEAIDPYIELCKEKLLEL
jgi:hypothetical protein